MAHYVAEKIALKSSIHAATVKISQQMVARSTSTHAQQNNFYYTLYNNSIKIPSAISVKLQQCGGGAQISSLSL